MGLIDVLKDFFHQHQYWIIPILIAVIVVPIIKLFGRKIKLAIVKPKLVIEKHFFEPILVYDTKKKPRWTAYLFKLPISNKNCFKRTTDSSANCKIRYEILGDDGFSGNLYWKNERTLDDELYYFNGTKEDWVNLFYKKNVEDRDKDGTIINKTDLNVLDDHEVVMGVHVEGLNNAYLIANNKRMLDSSKTYMVNIILSYARMGGAGSYISNNKFELNFQEKKFKKIGC